MGVSSFTSSHYYLNDIYLVVTGKRFPDMP